MWRNNKSIVVYGLEKPEVGRRTCLIGYDFEKHSSFLYNTAQQQCCLIQPILKEGMTL